MRRGRSAVAAAGAVAAAVLAVAGCAAGGAQAARPSAQQLTVRPSASPSKSPSPKPTPTPTHSAATTTGGTSERIAAPGTAGTFRVGRLQYTFTEPAHHGPSGEALGPRTLVTQLWYPSAPASAGSEPPRGGLPLLMFAPGFQLCAAPYGDLLASWASAGYVVAAVNFPRTDCTVASTAYEPDLINQPDDMSYVLTQLLALSSRPGDALSGMINSREVGAAGHSDGGDTVAALAANTCCVNSAFAAVAVLSGAEWPAMPGRYFSGSTPPMLFVQGSADTINPPWTSVQLYDSDPAADRYYLDLFGASHTSPYWGTNPVERITARVTLEFFDRYVLGQHGARAAMLDQGHVEGAAIVAGGQPVPGTG